MSDPERRDVIAGIGEQATYVAADHAHPFYGRESLARRVGFLRHFGPLSDADLAAVESEWRRLYPPSTSYSDAELSALLDMLDRLNPPPPLPADDELARMLSALDPGPPPEWLVIPDDDELARLIARLDDMGDGAP